MRIVLMFALLFLLVNVKAQTVIGNRYLTDMYGGDFSHHISSSDSSGHSKWSFSKYAGISMGYSFFKSGSASFIAAPLGLQLNRKLTDHVSAFAGISAAPVYLNSAFLLNNFSKTTSGTSFNKSGNLGMSSKVELGLMYTNEAKTFSISGSIGVEKNNTPVFYPAASSVRQNPVTSSH